MALVFTLPDDHGDRITYIYFGEHRLSPDTVAQGVEVEDSLLTPPPVEPWEQAIGYVIYDDGTPIVDWRIVDKEPSDPAHLFRELGELKPSALGVELWVPPTGAHDAPNDGDHRLHNDVVWRSTINGNTVEPGTHPGFDWWVETEPPAVPDRLRRPLAALRPQVEAAANIEQLRDAVLGILDTLVGT